MDVDFVVGVGEGGDGVDEVMIRGACVGLEVMMNSALDVYCQMVGKRVHLART